MLSLGWIQIVMLLAQLAWHAAGPAGIAYYSMHQTHTYTLHTNI